MSESTKKYKTHDTPDYANFHRTQLIHTHIQQTQCQSSPQARKRNFPPLKHSLSLKKTSGTYF